MSKHFKGIWFYGISGSGKSFASKYLKKKINKSFIIDGDQIRRINNHDLGHSIIDRKKQLSRLRGIVKLVIQQGYVPIISSVYIDNYNLKKLKKLNIILIEIRRSKSKINLKLKNKKKVIGKDLKLPNLKTIKIINNLNFKKSLEDLLLS